MRSDHGGEYLFGGFKDYLLHLAIVFQFITPGTFQQNVVAEKKNRTLLDTVKSMMGHVLVPVSL